MAVPNERSRPLLARPVFQWFARLAVQLLVFASFACLEGYNAASRASHGDFGVGFWFFTMAAMFFVLMAGLSLWQRKKHGPYASNAAPPK